MGEAADRAAQPRRRLPAAFLLGRAAHARATEQVAQNNPPCQTPLTRRELAERIIADALPVRFQVQMHKVIWPPDERGV